MKFNGYKRPDGKVGIRNHVLVLPASTCASDTTRIIASRVHGAVSFNNQNGCSQVGPDRQLTMDLMGGFAANPNVYGTVVVSLGCESCQMDLVVNAIEERKITGNRTTYESMRDDIDFDASPIIHGTEIMDDLAEKLLEMVIQVTE